MKDSSKCSLLSATAALVLFSSIPHYVSAGTDPYIGEISYVTFNYAPRNWFACDGQMISISQNPALYSLIGTTYGGDGRSTFALPDMRGRVPVHQGRGPGLNTYRIGYKGGSELMALSVNTLPAHTHIATATSDSQSSVAAGATATSHLKAANTTAGTNDASGNALANVDLSRGNVYSTTAPTVEMNAGSVVTVLDGVAINTNTITNVAIANTGNSERFPIMQPYLVVNCIIAMDGTFPPRD